MKGGAKIAEVYAESLFLIARDKGILDETREELESVKAVFDGHRNLEAVYVSPRISQSRKMRIIDAVFGGRLLESTIHLLKVLIRKRREGIFADIVRSFAEQLDRERNRVNIFIKTASPSDEKAWRKLRQALETKLGKTPVLRLEADPAIIGGFVLRYEDMVIDMSLQKELESLKERISSSIVIPGVIYEN